MPSLARPHAPTDPMLSIAAVAAELGEHTATTRRRVQRGELPAYRLGPKTIRIRRSDLDRFKYGKPVTPTWDTLGAGAELDDAERAAWSDAGAVPGGASE